MENRLSYENYKEYKKALENNWELGVESFNFNNRENPYECGYIYCVDDPSYKGNMGVYLTTTEFKRWFE